MACEVGGQPFLLFMQPSCPQPVVKGFVTSLKKTFFKHMLVSPGIERVCYKRHLAIDTGASSDR